MLTIANFLRPPITKLLLGAVVMLGLLGLFIALAGSARAGDDAKVTVNSTANIDDGECEGPPNDDAAGNCTLHEAIDVVNAGDADIINFHPPVFSKEQPGVIELCEDDGEGLLPRILRDVIIESKDSGVIIDGGSKNDECSSPVGDGIIAEAQQNGLDFTLNGGKNFEVRNLECETAGIGVTAFDGPDDFSLGTVEITGVIVQNICDDGVLIEGTNLESGSITNSEIQANEGAGVEIEIDACFDDCQLDDSILDISGNRIQGGVEECCDAGVHIRYVGELASGLKVTASVGQNEFISGTDEGVQIDFWGCGEGGVNFHVDENEEINGGQYDAVDINVAAKVCVEPVPGNVSGEGELVPIPGDGTDGFDAVVTVNGNGDIESTGDFPIAGGGGDGEGVTIVVGICCGESDSTSTVEVNENGRITGEDDGVAIDTFVCCGDDNVTDTSVNTNDEITGEGDDGISVFGFAGSSGAAGLVFELPPGASGVDFDADDNTCTITVDGNNEVDGVGGDTSHGTGIAANCAAGALGTIDPGGVEAAGAPLSSGDENVSTVSVTNNSDVAGDRDGIDIEGFAGSVAGEADDNVFTATVSGNGEVAGDEDDGVDIDIASGSDVEEGDDNHAEIVIEENAEIGGDGDHGLDLDLFAGGTTLGSERNSTATTIVQNGTIEGAGEDGDGINLDVFVCCDPDNTNDVNISNNKDEITGHDDDGIEINICCSANTITIMDNEGNIRGGDEEGLDLDVCDEVGVSIDGPSPFPPSLPPIAGVPLDFEDCINDSLTNLQIINNSFSDSEEDGIQINGGTFQDDDDVKSVISNNVVEGNGDDGIDIDSANGLNIGPGNEVFLNGTESGDNGIEIDWYLAECEWTQGDGKKWPANHNTITQNMIYDNFGLGIDLVGWDPDEGSEGCNEFEAEGEVGCMIYPDTQIAPNDCLPFPDLETQAGNKIIGTACSLCTVELFWADNDPDNNFDHGEGAEYIVSGEADEDGDFSIEIPCELEAGDLTATATDKLKNTSEFAENLPTLGGICPTDTPTDTPVPPTDTPVPPTPTEQPMEKVCGDVNMDGVANSIDASLILQLKADLIDTLANESSGDVNNDGAITSVDAALILQYVAALIDEGALTCP